VKPHPKILVIVTRRIGDVLLTTPLIRSLRRAWPEAHIDVLVFTGTEGILADNPDINRIITVAQRPAKREHLRLLMSLWRSYDIALSTLSGDRPSLYARIAGKFCAGEVDGGSKNQWKRMLLSQTVQTDNNTHTVLMHLKLADVLGVPRSHEVVVAWQAGDEAKVREAIPFDLDTQAYAVLHVHPMYAYKAWRSGAWVELADWLIKQGMRIVLTGGNSAEEIAKVRELLGRLPRDTVDVTGKLSLSGVAYLLGKARAYVGPDTVVTHLAAASGTPTVALFGPSNPVKWGPWPKGFGEDRNPYRMKGTQRVNNVVLLQGTGDCVPCMEEGCERHIASLSDCLQKLPSASAIAALRELLNSPYQRVIGTTADVGAVQSK
jgi:heptosyltransferase-3